MDRGYTFALLLGGIGSVILCGCGIMRSSFLSGDFFLKKVQKDLAGKKRGCTFALPTQNEGLSS